MTTSPPRTGALAALVVLAALFATVVLMEVQPQLPDSLARFVEVFLRALELVASFVGIVAIWYAIEHKLEIANVRDALSDQLNHLRVVANSVTTRYRGPFPQHIAEIVLLVESANRGDHISAVADCVDYGSFFGPHLHDELFRALKRAAENEVVIHLAAVGPLSTMTYNSRVSEEAFSVLLVNGDFRRDLVQYLASIREDRAFLAWLRKELGNGAATLIQWVRQNDVQLGIENATAALSLTRCLAICEDRDLDFGPADEQAFTMLLRCRELYFEKELTQSGVTVKRFPSAGRAAIFFWLVGDDDAVFTLGDTGAQTRGLGFRTRDTKLIEVLRDAFRSRWDTAP